MSRTYRASFLELDCGCGAPAEPKWSWNKGKTTESVIEAINAARRKGVPYDRTCNCGYRWDYYSKRNLKRDHKNYNKLDKKYKQVSKKHFRAKVSHEMNNHRYDTMPRLLKTDVWDWN